MGQIVKSIQHYNLAEPRWQVYQHLHHGKIDAALLQWLLDGSSLTQRMIQACSGRFAVEVLSQQWERPMLNEAIALNIRPHHHALVRQVRLLCNGKPWVFARTVIPASTLKGAVRRLAYLGNKPLGAVLFADPSMRRDAIEIAALSPRTHHYAQALQGQRVKPKQIWGRRSVFYLSGKPLLVSEFFLPGMMEK